MQRSAARGYDAAKRKRFRLERLRLSVVVDVGLAARQRRCGRERDYITSRGLTTIRMMDVVNIGRFRKERQRKLNHMTRAKQDGRWKFLRPSSHVASSSSSFGVCGIGWPGIAYLPVIQLP